MRAWLAVALVALAVSAAEAQYTPGCVIVATSATTIGCSGWASETLQGVGIGTTSPSGTLHLNNVYTETSIGERAMLFSLGTLMPTGTAVGSFYGLHLHEDVPVGVTANFTGAITGALVDPHYSGSGQANVYQAVEASPQAMSGSIGMLRGLRAVASTQGSAVTTAEAISAQIQSVNGGTIQTAYGFHLYGGSGSTGVVTSYGSRIESLSGAVRWSFYADADRAYFGGGIIDPTLCDGLVRAVAGRLVSC